MVRTTKNLYMYLLCFCPREHHHRYVVITFVWTPFYPLFYAELDFFSHSSQQGARSKSSSSPASTA